MNMEEGESRFCGACGSADLLRQSMMLLVWFPRLFAGTLVPTSCPIALAGSG